MGYPELKLIQDVSTQWNSTYDMFQRCIDIKAPLMSTIAIIGNVNNLLTKILKLWNITVLYLNNLKKL